VIVKGNMMAVTPEFFWRKDIDQQDGLELIMLGCRQGGVNGNILEAWIAPSHGSNLCRLSVDGKHVIDFDRSLLVKHDFTGTPVLYPTPNRVRNGVFRYQGKAYNQVKRGVRILEHGLVHNEAWNYLDAQVNPDSIMLTTWIDFEESCAMFQAFPFRHRLSLEFCLTRAGLQVSYTVENKGDQTIPFGFGLHPYFTKLSGDEGTCVELPANYVMDYTSDLLPTGRLIEVGGTQFDLRKKVELGALDLDHVFTGLPDGKCALIYYDTLHMQVQLVASSDFSHLVLYSPRCENYFCLENQTCSTDAHNLADRNFALESGLKFVLPGKFYTGSVSYLIVKEV
jgi:aldose 1-epimerase